MSIASLWELAAKASAGRLPEFVPIVGRGPEAMEAALRESNIQLLEVKLRHVAALDRMDSHHTDPFDRMIIAQALTEDLTLVTRDEIFHRYAHLKLLPA